MARLADLSIRNKLIVVIASVAIATMVAGFTTLIVRDRIQLRREMVEQTQLVTRLAGDYSVAELAFGNRNEASESLSKLALLPELDCAYLYDAQGEPFASFERFPQATPMVPEVPISGEVFTADHLFVSEPIDYQGERYGRLVVCASTSDLDDRLGRSLVTMLLLLGFLSSLSVATAMRLQKVISQPILELASIARAVSTSGDYSLRAPPQGRDEIGALYQAWNYMLEQIERRQEERRRYEEALRASERRFRTLIEESNDAIHVTVGSHFAYVNRRFKEYFDYSIEDASSRDFDLLMVVAPESRPAIRRRQEARGRGEEVPTRYEFAGLSRDGRYQTFEASSSEIEWDGMPAVMETLRNTTDRTEAEARLRHQRLQLEISNRKLARYTVELERSNRELDQFAYIVSHDLKTPLRAIINLSEWIEEDLEGSLEGQTAHQMQLLRNRTRRMEALIDGILEYSRVIRRQSSEEVVDLRELIGEVVEDVAVPPAFKVRLVGEMPVITSPRLRLHQVLSNLIGNAVKYHDRPQGTIEIEVREKGEAWEIEVRDDGPGIPPEFHEKIFLIFQTLERRDVHESTGIGLALVKKIVEERGGRIRVESEEGRGATFRFTWPKAPAGSVHEADPPETGDPGDPGDPGRPEADGEAASRARHLADTLGPPPSPGTSDDRRTD